MIFAIAAMIFAICGMLWGRTVGLPHHTLAAPPTAASNLCTCRVSIASASCRGVDAGLTPRPAGMIRAIRIYSRIPSR
jgi:hypothetical protein